MYTYLLESWKLAFVKLELWLVLNHNFTNCYFFHCLNKSNVACILPACMHRRLWRYCLSEMWFTAVKDGMIERSGLSPTHDLGLVIEKMQLRHKNYNYLQFPIHIMFVLFSWICGIFIIPVVVLSWSWDTKEIQCRAEFIVTEAL